MEFLIIKCRPFYLPRDFTTVIVAVVYTAPSAHAKANTLALPPQRRVRSNVDDVTVCRTAQDTQPSASALSEGQVVSHSAQALSIPELSQPSSLFPQPAQTTRAHASLHPRILSSSLVSTFPIPSSLTTSAPPISIPPPSPRLHLQQRLTPVPLVKILHFPLFLIFLTSVPQRSANFTWPHQTHALIIPYSLQFPSFDILTLSNFNTFAHSILKIKSSTIQVYISGINFFIELSSGAPCNEAKGN